MEVSVVCSVCHCCGRTTPRHGSFLGRCLRQDVDISYRPLCVTNYPQCSGLSQQTLIVSHGFSGSGIQKWLRCVGQARGVSGVVRSEAGLGRGCFTPILMVGGRPQFFPHGPSAAWMSLQHGRCLPTERVTPKSRGERNRYREKPRWKQ